MKNIDPTVKKETVYVLAVSIILSALMQSVFLIARFWDYTVLLGNVLGVLAGVGNFFLLGLTVQSALGKEEKEAKDKMRLSHTLRNMGLLIVAVIGYVVPVFNILAVIIPFLFPRVAVALRPLIKK